MEGWTYGETYIRTYVWTVDDVIAIKPRFLASMGYHIFLTMVLRARAPLANQEGPSPIASPSIGKCTVQFFVPLLCCNVETERISE